MPAPDFKLPLKPGHTSTEFWLTIAAGLITTALSAVSMLDVTWAVGAITVLTLGYNASRSKLKTIQAEAEAATLKAAAAAPAPATPPPGNVIPFPDNRPG